MNPLIERLGWMLLHSVWEDILIWGMLQLALGALARKSPQTRYLAACLALVAMAGLPWLTFDAADLSARLKASPPVSGEMAVSPSSPAGHVFSGELSRETTASLSGDMVSTGERPNELSLALPFLVALWGVGLLFSCIRLWMKWRHVQALLRQPFQLLDSVWRQRFERLVQLSGVERIVRLGETAAVSVPVVAGWLKPVILLPLGVVMSLPTEQVEAILLHELAHISRHDYLVNLLQSIVETIFFYHPAVWAVSRRIRRERELACDDLTVRWCQDPRTYAQALAGFEEYRRHQLLLAATGEGELVARIRRILTGPQPEGRGVPLFAVAGFCGIGLYLASMLLVPVLAQQVMTAKERVARIEALQPPPGHLSSVGDTILVEGTLRTEDNQPLPKRLMAPGTIDQPTQSMICSRQGNCWMTGALLIEQGGRFEGSPTVGTIGIGIWTQGYAPLQIDGLRAKDGKRLDLDLTLKRGFPGRVRLTGPKGEPIEGVTVTARSTNPQGDIILAMPPVQTDSHGIAAFGKVEADSLIHLSATGPGWQTMYGSVAHWSDQEPSTIAMRAAIPTSGIAVDGETHQPVAKAEILLADCRASDPSTSTSYLTDNAPVLGQGDAAGHFNLDSLNNDYTYRVYIRAPGYLATSFPIQPGDQNKVFSLQRGFHIKGRILDPEGKLGKLSGPVELRCDYLVTASLQSAFMKTELQTLSRLGPEIPFTFTDLPQGKFSFFLNRQWYMLYLQKSVDDFVIDLGSKDTSYLAGDPSSRKVRIVLETASGQIPPTGEVNVSYTYNTTEVPHMTDFATAPIRNGVAEVDLPTPTVVTLSASGVNGYWFHDPGSFEVPVGTGPFVRTLQGIPAGVIHGGVIVAPHLKGRAFFISALVIKSPPEAKNSYLGSSPGQVLTDHYVTPSLPFGGTYAAVLQAGPSFFVSPPAVIDAAHPLVVRDLDLVAGDTLTAKFVDEHHLPIGFQGVNLVYHPAEASGGYTNNIATTDGGGSVTISDLNFNVPGNYELQLFGDAWENSSLRIDRHTPQPVTIVMRHRAR